MRLEAVGFVLVMFGAGGFAWMLRDAASPMAYLNLAAIVAGAAILLVGRARGRLK